MKRFLFIALFFLAGCSPAIAQYDYQDMDSIIVNNIYENPSQIITGAILQGVMINQNKSYTNKVSDTSYIHDFDTLTVFYKGALVLHGMDTIYKTITNHSGRWRLSDFEFYQIIGSGTSGSVTSITSGYGLTSSPNPITSTGNLKIDTSKIATKAFYLVTVSTATLTLTSSSFNGNFVYEITNTSGTERINLPNPSTVSNGGVVLISMSGGNVPTVYPFASETLDRQNTSTSGEWTIPAHYSISLNYVLPQEFKLTTNTINWFTLP